MRISDWSSDVCSSDLGNAFGQIAALDFDLADFGARKGRTDFFLDEFSCGFTDKHAVDKAVVVADGFVELVATDTHRTLVHHAAQGNAGPLGAADADIPNNGTATPANRRVGQKVVRTGI